MKKIENVTSHKGKKLREHIGAENYDVLFDIVNEYWNENEYRLEDEGTIESVKRFMKDVKRLKEKFF